MNPRDKLFKGGMSVSFGKSFAKRYGNLTVGEALELNKKTERDCISQANDV